MISKSKQVGMLLIAIALSMTLFTSCEDEDSMANKAKMFRALWDSKGLDDYVYRFEAPCYCWNFQASPCRVFVVSDTIQQILSVNVDTPKQHAWLDTPWQDLADRASLFTVEEMFELVDEAIAAGNVHKLKFHPELGYPEELHYGVDEVMIPPTLDATRYYLMKDLKEL